MIKRLKKFLKRITCPHTEWDADYQIRIIQCRRCNKKAWIKEYKDIYK